MARHLDPIRPRRSPVAGRNPCSLQFPVSIILPVCTIPTTDRRGEHGVARASDRLRSTRERGRSGARTLSRTGVAPGATSTVRTRRSNRPATDLSRRHRPGLGRPPPRERRAVGARAGSEPGAQARSGRAPSGASPHAAPGLQRRGGRAARHCSCRLRAGCPAVSAAECAVANTLPALGTPWRPPQRRHPAPGAPGAGSFDCCRPRPAGGYAAMPTMGAFRWVAPSEPEKAAFPKVKMPPSLATSQ